MDEEQGLVVLEGLDIPGYVLETVKEVGTQIGVMEPFERRQGTVYEAALLGMAMKNDLVRFPALAARTLMRNDEVAPPSPGRKIEGSVASALQTWPNPTMMRTVEYVQASPFAEYVEKNHLMAEALGLDEASETPLLTRRPPKREGLPQIALERLTTDMYAHLAHGLLLGMSGGTSLNVYEFSRYGESLGSTKERAAVWLRRLMEESLTYRRRYENRVKGRRVGDELLDIEAGREAIAADAELYMFCLELVTEKIGMHKYEAIID